MRPPSLSTGCGPSGAGARNGKTEAASAGAKPKATVVGVYGFKVTPEVELQLKQNEDNLGALKAKADAGDRGAQAVMAGIPKNAPSELSLLKGITLKLTDDNSFTFRLVDRATGRFRNASGTYAVDGAKLTLTFTAIDGKKAEGADAKTLSMTFDEENNTLTGDTGSGPKLVMKKP